MKRFKVMLVALGLLLFGAVGTQAQSNSMQGGLTTLPSANWVSSAEAEVLLDQHITQLTTLIQTLTPNTQPYQDVLRNLMCYRFILQEVVDGKQIPESIVFGLENCAVDRLGTGNPSKTQMVALRDEAVDMLSN